MSDSVENAGFDVEAQESLLEASAEEGASEAETTSNSARKTLMRFILLIRSTELFKLGANCAADITSSSSTSASYAPITSSDEILTQGSGIVAALEVSADSTHHEDILGAQPASDNYEHINELQQIQSKNITEIVKKKNLQDLCDFGGVGGVAEALNTDLEKGIFSPHQCNLSQFFLTFFRSFLGACNNYTVFLLSCAAVLSLGFGITEEGLRMGWFNGGVLIVTVFIIVICPTIHECWEKWSRKKLENSGQSKGRMLQVRVIRGGAIHFVRQIDLQVGDIAVLQRGDQVPADGLFVSNGQALELDDDLINSTIDENNPFLFYGSRVINGNARMLVTSTLMDDTVWDEMMSEAMETSADNECRVESYLRKLSTCVHIAGLLLSILIIIVLFLRYKAGKLDDERRFRPDSKGEPTTVRTIIDAIKGIITGSRGTARVLTTLLSVSLLGIMEGIPFAISVAAIIWSSKTLAHKAAEGDYLACIKMACVTTICTDKFGGMTEHEKKVDKFYVGGEFVSESTIVAPEVLEGLRDGIGTLLFLKPPNDCESELLLLISWAEEKLDMKRESVIDQCKMIRHRGRNPLRERCQVQMEKNGNGGYLHVKGPPQDILPMCSHHYDIDGRIWDIDAGKRRMLEQASRDMQAEEAEVIAYAFTRVGEFDEVPIEPNHLTLLAMISVKKTNAEDTKEAVSTLKEGGIRTVLASGDYISVLEPIGQKHGLLTNGSDDLVLSAEVFRAWTDKDRKNNVEKIRILGNCLPSDKILLIKCLREKGQVVALLAQRTVDAPALKQADIGVAYGVWSSELARECCNIDIWYGNCFSFLVNVIKNGRCFLENIRKFIQLQLIITISSSLINFIAVVSCGDAPITAVQLFWLNLAVGLVGGLALLTGPSTSATLMTNPPVESSAKLITKDMWRDIAIQVLYQTTIFLALQHNGHAILGTSGGRVKSVIYNGFFLCQMFNIFIAREPEKKNIFSGLFHMNNCWFWVALVIFIISQAVFAVAEVVLGSSPGLNLVLWGVCLLIGLVSLLLDWAGKIASNFIAKWAADTTWKLNWVTSRLPVDNPTQGLSISLATTLILFSPYICCVFSEYYLP